MFGDMAPEAGRCDCIFSATQSSNDIVQSVAAFLLLVRLAGF